MTKSRSYVTSKQNQVDDQLREIQEWRNNHPDMKNLITICKSKIQTGSMSKSNDTSMRMAMNINGHISKLHALSQKINESYNKLDAKGLPTHHPFVYSSQENNYQIRVLHWLRIYIRNKKKKWMAGNIAFLNSQIEIAQQALEFFNLYTIPKGYNCTLSEGFYNSQLKTMDKHVHRLCKYKKQVKDVVSHFPEPLAYTDLPIFFRQQIDAVIPRLDSDLTYIPEIPEEIELSRCFLTPDLSYIQKIDTTLHKFQSISNDEFAENVANCCFEILPRPIHYSPEQQAIGVLFIFRIVYNRFYELFPVGVPKPHAHDELISKIVRLWGRPSADFILPRKLIRAHPPEQPIRELFQQDNTYMAASQFLEDAFYMSNPIDSLYCIHRALLSLNKGALINRLGAGDASEDDISQILCFDDLFGLLFGSLMASDIPDIFALAEYINDYIPRHALSPAFEYAHANLEALMLHLRELDETNLGPEASS